MRKRSELFFSLILVPIDFVALTAAFVLAYIIRVKLDGRPVAHPIEALIFLKISLIILPIWIIIFALSGLYSLSSLRGRAVELGRVFMAVSGGVMAMILLDFFSRVPLFPSRAVPIYAYGLGLMIVVLARTIVRVIQRSLFRSGIGLHQAILVGSGELAVRIAAELGQPSSGYQILAAIDTAKGAAKRLGDIPTFDSFAAALDSLGGKEINDIIQADSALDQDEVLQLVHFSTNNHISYRFVANQFGIYATNSTIGTLAGIPVIEMRLTPLDGWGRILKRFMDVILSGLGLVILSPIFLIVAIITRLTDPGPVIFHHSRLSRQGVPIKVYKFRSMYLKYCTGADYSGKSDAEVLSEELGQPELAVEFAREQKLTSDPRVSPFGEIIRRTSIDELPQLWNVLRGDLSLVGPRPIVEIELARYGDESMRFLALKPGLTGLWQTSGRSDLSYEERIKLDIYYVENWSLWLDLRILFRTAIMLVSGKGAY